MKTPSTVDMQETFHQLSQPQQLAIIYHGALWRLADLQKRHFLAESKVRIFEATYQHTLQQWEQQGLPDDASPTMHEDYILWNHWAGVMAQAEEEIDRLQSLISQGPPSRDVFHGSN
jgi:hypothetical protein